MSAHPAGSSTSTILRDSSNSAARRAAGSGPGRRTRWYLLLFSLVMLAGVMILSPRLLNEAIGRALTRRDYDAAELWIARAEIWHAANAETAFHKARLSRKLLQFSEFPGLLAEAAAQGFDPEALKTEAILFQAQIGQIRQVVTQMNDLMVHPGSDGAEICEAYVNGALIAGSRDVARMILPVWKQEFPQDPQPHYAHARLLEFEGHSSAAEQELQTALQKNDQHWPSHYALGRILLEKNQLAAAIQQFEAAAAMRHNAAPLLQKARCLRTNAQPELALQILEELALLPAEAVNRSFAQVGEPEHGMPIQLELGLVHATLQNSDQAVAWLDQVLEQDPQHLDARYARAMALRDLGNLSEAEAEFQHVQNARTQLLEVDRLVDEINESPELLNLEKRCRIGELFIRYENARRGEFWLKETLNLDPDYRPAHALLAEYYTQLSRREPAYAAIAETHRQAAAAPEGLQD